MRTGLLRKSDQYRYVAEQRKAKTIDRFKVFRWVLDLQVPPGEWVNKMPLFCLAVPYNANTGQCRPTIATIARQSGLSERQVNRCISQYVSLGWVSRVKRGWHGRATIYALHVHLNPVPVLMGTPGVSTEGSTLSPLVVTVPPTAPIDGHPRHSINPVGVIETPAKLSSWEDAEPVIIQCLTENPSYYRNAAKALLCRSGETDPWAWSMMDRFEEKYLGSRLTISQCEHTGQAVYQWNTISNEEAATDGEAE